MKIETAELGRRLKARRVASGRTIASVAVDAGLSVPYIANLENGRGNPTLSALSALAGALGARLRVDLHDEADAAQPAELPDSLVRFGRLPRFAADAKRIAKATGAPVTATRERLLAAMAGIGALSPREPEELDWHRILDTVLLVTRA